MLNQKATIRLSSLMPLPHIPLHPLKLSLPVTSEKPDFSASSGSPRVTVKPRQGRVKGLLHVIRLAGVFPGPPVDVDLFGYRVPRDTVFMSLPTDISFSHI